MNVRIGELPRYYVAYMRHVGPYGAHGIPALWKRLHEWTRTRGLDTPDSTKLGIGHDDPDVTAVEKCRYDACVVVSPDFAGDKWVNVMDVPGGKVAIRVFTGTAHEIEDAWSALYRTWLPGSGRSTVSRGLPRQPGSRRAARRVSLRALHPGEAARCLTGVEDIATEAMLAGIDWTWESFPEYLATVRRLPKAINYGAYLGHSALRMYVMGERALTEKAREDDLTAMVAMVKEASRSGAMGFSSSRATTHVTPDNTPVASRIADWAEIDRLVGAMAELNAGIFQIGPDISGGEAQRRFFARLKQVAVATRRPVMFGAISSLQGDKPNPWTYQLEYLDDCAAAGATMWGQATTRSINAIFSLKSYL